MSTPLRVLLVEDFEDDAALIVRELQHGGFEPEFERVDTAAAISAALGQQKWDIVLCDYTMPQFNGAEALKLLQQSGQDIPFILVSGKIGEEEAVAIMKAGANDFLFKDRLRRLVPAVKRELRSAELRRERRQAEEAVKQTEQNFRNSVENSPLGMLIVSEENEIFYANKAILDTWGYDSREEIKAVPLARRFTPESCAAVLERRQKRRQGEAVPSPVEVSIVRKDGEIRHLRTWRRQIVWDGKRQNLVLWEDITERRQAEEALQWLELKYATLVEQSNDGIIIIQDGLLRFVNNRMSGMTGFSREEALGKPFLDFVAPDHQALLADSYQKKLVGKESSDRYEFEILSKKGAKVPVEINTSLIEYEGKPGIMAIVRDITELKQAEQALKESEEKYRILVENASDLIFRIDKNNRVQSVNAASANFLDKKSEEIVGKTIFDLFPEEIAQRLSQNLHRVFETRASLNEENTLPVHGKEIWVTTALSPLKNAANEVIAVTGVSRDITERKQMEEALRKSEERYHGLVTNVGLGIFRRIPGSAGRLLEVNPAMEEITGYTREELLNMDSRDLWVHPEQRDAVLKETAFATGKVTFEINLRRKDGKEIIAADTIAPVRDSAGRVVCYDGILADITERKRMEQKIQRLYALLFAVRKINQVLLRVKDETELFQEVCNCLVDVDFIKFAWVGLVEKGSYEVKPMAHAGFEAGFLSTIRVTWDESQCGRGSTGTAIKTGHPVIVGDLANDLRYHPWREEELKRGYAAHISVPLAHGKETVGVLSIYSRTAGAFGDEEVGFLAEVAGDVAVGMKTLRLEKELQQNVEGMHAALLGTIKAISSISEMRDPYTAGQELAVARLACAIATEMGLTEEQIEGLWVAGCIHDLGKVGVPSEILSTPRKLMGYEVANIKSHPEVAYDILKSLQFPWPVAQAILQHHERLDGSGYPAGLTGEQIILEAKILAVADVVEAMSSHRPYRPALGPDRALLEMMQKKGVLYDPEVVDVCVRLFTDKGFKLGGNITGGTVGMVGFTAPSPG